MKATKMNIFQHQKLGRAIKDAEMAILEVYAGHHYGATAKETKALWKALGVLKNTRNIMDSAVFREYPMLSTHELISFYYGKDSVEVQS